MIEEPGKSGQKLSPFQARFSTRSPAGVPFTDFSSPSSSFFPQAPRSHLPPSPRPDPCPRQMPLHTQARECSLRAAQGFCSLGGRHEGWASPQTREEAASPGIVPSSAPVPLQLWGWGWGCVRGLPGCPSTRALHGGRPG